MKETIKDTIRGILNHFDIGVTRLSSLKRLQKSENAISDLEFLQAFSDENVQEILKYLLLSKSQLRQDLFVLAKLDFKRNGYFVEFGATNGFDLSNTFLMEKEFGWSGILAEPAKCWHDDLKRNRSCSIETDCVWKITGSKLRFNEVDYAELSTIQGYSKSDNHKRDRSKYKSYDVSTISLNDLLSKYDAPNNIDYLSIDTEGSEFDILNAFDFEKHNIKIISCEHNYSSNRDRIYILLSNHGYLRVHSELSKFDDWYIKA